MPGWVDLVGWYTRPKTVTHPSTDQARRALTSFMRQNAANHYATPPVDGNFRAQSVYNDLYLVAVAAGPASSIGRV